MKRVVILISLLLILTSFTPKSQTLATMPLTKVARTLTLVQNKNHYFIRVKLNDREANMLIDTGSAASFIDINQAKYYDFEFRESEVVFNGFGGTKESYHVSSYRFECETTMLKVYPFGANLEGLTQSFSNKGIRFTGILGSDFFERNDAIIDYKNKQLIIYE